MTQTPASGPFGPLTTPPRSVLPIETAAACCALTLTGALARNAAVAITATLKYKPVFILIVLLLRGFPRRDTFRYFTPVRFLPRNTIAHCPGPWRPALCPLFRN